MSIQRTAGNQAICDLLSRTDSRRLQRSAGNVAVTKLLHAHGNGAQLQRVRVDLTAGGSVGDAPATNHREGVLLVLDRLHLLWGIENRDYDAVYPAVSALAPGTAVTDRATLATLQAALRRLDVPILPAPVGQAQFGLPLGGWVGRGQANATADVVALQDLLHARGLLSDAARAREQANVSGGRRDDASLRETLVGLSRLKMEAVAGLGKAGWSPLIRADEARPGGGDRLADRTFECGQFVVFVPSGATRSLVNRVHVFFSAGGVIGASSHVEHHGLRGAAEPHEWILVGVQGAPGQAFTISDSEIRDCLASIGRPAQIASVRMSAHSRGNGSMAATLRGRLIPSGLIDHVTVLDGSDFAHSLTEGFRRSHVPPSKITADFVTTGAFPLPGVRSQGMDAECIRAIGYARLINDAVGTGRIPVLPSAIAALVAALPLPPRGSFSAETPPPPGKTSIAGFCRDRAHAPALRALRRGERHVANVGQLAGNENTSAYAFVEWNDLLNLRDPAAPRNQWRSVTPGIYSHHLFVAEVADDLFR